MCLCEQRHIKELVLADLESKQAAYNFLHSRPTRLALPTRLAAWKCKRTARQPIPGKRPGKCFYFLHEWIIHDILLDLDHVW